MSTTTTWPLLLQLSTLQPVKSSASVLETPNAERDMVGVQYNPLTQVAANPKATVTDVVADTVVVDQNGNYITTQHNDHLNYDEV